MSEPCPLALIAITCPCRLHYACQMWARVYIPCITIKIKSIVIQTFTQKLDNRLFKMHFSSDKCFDSRFWEVRLQCVKLTDCNLISRQWTQFGVLNCSIKHFWADIYCHHPKPFIILERSIAQYCHYYCIKTFNFGTQWNSVSNKIRFFLLLYRWCCRMGLTLRTTAKQCANLTIKVHTYTRLDCSGGGARTPLH